MTLGPQGKYIVVQDSNDTVDKLETTATMCAPNFYQTNSGDPIYASGQPTVKGINSVLSRLTQDGHTVE